VHGISKNRGRDGLGKNFHLAIKTRLRRWNVQDRDEMFSSPIPKRFRDVQFLKNEIVVGLIKANCYE